MEMKYCTIQLFEKYIGMLDFVILLSVDNFYDHEITQYTHCVILLCVSGKAFVISLFCCK